jgi:hypothetical protein
MLKHVNGVSCGANFLCSTIIFVSLCACTCAALVHTHLNWRQTAIPAANLNSTTRLV